MEEFQWRNGHIDAGYFCLFLLCVQLGTAWYLRASCVPSWAGIPADIPWWIGKLVLCAHLTTRDLLLLEFVWQLNRSVCPKCNHGKWNTQISLNSASYRYVNKRYTHRNHVERAESIGVNAALCSGVHWILMTVFLCNTVTNRKYGNMTSLGALERLFFKHCGSPSIVVKHILVLAITPIPYK